MQYDYKKILLEFNSFVEQYGFHIVVSSEAEYNFVESIYDYENIIIMGKSHKEIIRNSSLYQEEFKKIKKKESVIVDFENEYSNLKNKFSFFHVLRILNLQEIEKYYL